MSQQTPSAQGPERYLIVDLEATCWQGRVPAQNEIIEIGAVQYEVGVGNCDDFQTFVRPILQPTLSDFCKELTQITQADVDVAPSFPEALTALCQWAESFAPYTLAAWGNYDRNQLRKDCALHGVRYPFGKYINIKQAFANLEQCPPQGMAGALRRVNLPLVGTHHRGIDDVRNIARLVDYLIDTYSPRKLREAGRVAG